MKKSIRWLLIAAAMGAASLAAGCGSISDVERGTPTQYAGQVTQSGMTMGDQLRKYAPEVNQDIAFVMGSCGDLTGGYRDTSSGMPGYSRAVTQGGADIMGTFVKMAGFHLVDRSPYNFGMMGQEHNLGMRPVTPVDPKNPDAPRQYTGYISTHILPAGMLGSNYMITCDITSYDPDVTSGGGGGSWDAAGVSFSRSAAEVGIVVKLESMATTEVIDSVYLTDLVEGQTIDLHVTRFLGDAANTALTVLGSGSTSTVLSQKSNLHLASGEVGAAFQLPIHVAVDDSFMTGLTLLLQRNKSILYKPNAKVNFDYSAPAGK